MRIIFCQMKLCIPEEFTCRLLSHFCERDLKRPDFSIISRTLWHGRRKRITICAAKFAFFIRVMPAHKYLQRFLFVLDRFNSKMHITFFQFSTQFAWTKIYLSIVSNGCFMVKMPVTTMINKKNKWKERN